MEIAKFFGVFIPPFSSVSLYGFINDSNYKHLETVFYNSFSISVSSFFAICTFILKMELINIIKYIHDEYFTFIKFMFIICIVVSFFIPHTTFKSIELSIEKIIIYSAITLISFILLTSVIFMKINFQDLVPDQIISVIAGEQGKDSEGSSLLIIFLLTCVLPSLFFTVIVIKNLKTLPSYFTLGKLKLFVFPLLRVLVLLLFSLYAFYFQTCLHMVNEDDDPFIKDHFVDPKKTQIKWPKKNKNLIVIFLESFESTYTSRKNGGFFIEDKMPNLAKMALNPKNVHFSHNEKVGGGAYTMMSHWSVAGQFSTFSGLPMKTGNDPTRAIPYAYTLLEMLYEKGYSIAYFASCGREYGLGNFYDIHGEGVDMYYEDRIRNESTIPKYKKEFGWGTFDHVVYRHVYRNLSRRGIDDPPFFYIIATSETHFENGYPCDHCIKKHKYQYFDCMQCADREATKFLNSIKKLPFYNDTVVFLVGDHFSMSKRLSVLFKGFKRSIFNLMLNSNIKPVKNATSNRKFMTHDWFPTIIAAMGGKIKGEKLGLGTNLFSGVKTLAETYSPWYINNRLTKASTFYTDKFIKGIGSKNNNDLRLIARAKWI